MFTKKKKKENICLYIAPSLNGSHTITHHCFFPSQNSHEARRNDNGHTEQTGETLSYTVPALYVHVVTRFVCGFSYSP